MQLRPATPADLPQLVDLQQAAAVVALAEAFPQDTHPFPRETILHRWCDELNDPEVAAYVAVSEDGTIHGFAARRRDELLHFGTSIGTWGTGLASVMHDALLTTYPPGLDRVWLHVFEANPRARTFWEKHGWVPTGRTARTRFEPHPVLLEYERPLPAR